MHGCLRAMRTLGRPRRRLAIGLLCAALTGHGAAASGVFAQDKQPHLLLEPTDYTDVIDAFDDDDPSDVNVTLTFARTRHVASIAREYAAPGDQAAGRFLPIAQSEQVTNALALEVELGLYKDLMAYARLPLVLSDTRRLRRPAGASSSCSDATCVEHTAQIDDALGVRTAPDGSRSGGLFDLASGYQSATRSGIGAFDVGIAWGVVNQYRTPYLPTWVLAIEARIGIGKIMKPCTDGAACETGVSRGTARLAFSSRWSRRWRFFEPYLGLQYALEWATAASERFAPHGDLPGYVDTTPPSMGETTLGTAFIAWEDRARFQRFAIDVRGRAAYISAGRDYTPLFDALGMSMNEHLATPNVTASGASVPFRGLTNVDGHARLGLEVAAAIQAARYVRFRLGVALWRLTSHLLTAAMPCASATSETCPESEVNALYRPIIDLPGQRFRLSADLAFDLFASATGQF
jgi:hypothetical protein